MLPLSRTFLLLRNIADHKEKKRKLNFQGKFKKILLLLKNFQEIGYSKNFH